MGCQWKCPMCKGNTQGSNVNASEIARVVDASIKNSLSGFENAVKTLDVKIKEAVRDSFASFKDEIKAEIDTQFKAIEDRIHTLEQSSGMAKDNNTLKDLVTTEVATLKKTLDEQFENRVKAMIAEDRERQKRKLNIVFGQEGLQRSSYPAVNYPSPPQAPNLGMYGGIGFAEPNQRPSYMPGSNQSS
ncbi:hypothetical protein QYM36_007719, partial [Artemia franciscana]